MTTSFMVDREAPGSPVLFGRRGLPRIGIALPVLVEVGGLSTPLLGRTRDLGMNGICAATPTCFAYQDVRGIALHGPEGKLHLAAEGRWQEEAAGRDAFFTGISLCEPQDSSVDRLWDIVHGRTKWLTRWLAQQSEFAALDLRDLLELAHVTRLRDLRVGQVLYRQAIETPSSDSLFVVLSGRLALELRTARERRVDVAELGPGSVFGGLGLVTELPPHETCIAAADSSLLEVSRGAFINLKCAAPGLAFELAAIAVRCHSARIVSALGGALDRG